MNMEYVNALLQNETYRDMADTHEYVMFPAYISGCRSMNRNLFVDGKATHRLVLTECRSEITLRVICVLDILVEKLEYLLAHEAEEEDRTGIWSRFCQDFVGQNCGLYAGE